ncbi:J domain-containing protein [Dinghuibacter silviterrae]|uniref:DnaJ-like protein n=1 Tax=Dinghuibacter silviterrae TaxID=1539049 RepID=A0A4R8DSS1_9BACT|nr:DnaJ domain-containing protein [Dinghuibacter silviterrae]TDX00455.1 DnaJ-like protein [Dinghuibacter silviterrae]
MKNYYIILGVLPTATPEEIKSAYRKRSMQYHPDRNPEGDELMRDLNEAYTVLIDEDARKMYAQKYKQYLAWEKQKKDYESRKVYQITFGSDFLNIFYNAMVKDPAVLAWQRLLGHTYLIVVGKQYSASHIYEFIKNVMPGKQHLIIEVNVNNHSGWLPKDTWNWLNQFSKPAEVPTGI